MYSGKTGDSTEMPFGMVGRIGPRNDLLDGVQVKGNFFFGGEGGAVQCNVYIGRMRHQRGLLSG